jgi:hypothetical protein
MAGLRFGVVSESVRAGRAWLDFARQVEDSGVDVLRLPAAFDAKMGVIREAAGDRFGSLEINAFGTFILTGRRRAETEDLIARRGWTGLGVEDVWQMPTIFIGSPEQIRSDLAERQARFGLSYLVAGEESLPALAEIAAGL